MRPAEKDVHGDNITVLALPSVRRYAYEHDVDLSQVVPSGRHGQIRKEDVDAYLAGGSVKPAATPTPLLKNRQRLWLHRQHLHQLGCQTLERG